MSISPHSSSRLPGAAPTAYRLLALASALALSACASSDPDAVEENACLQVSDAGAVYNPGNPGEGGAPEIPTGFASKKNVSARSFMVVAANPLATKAGCDVLKAGGSAVDAAIATQMVLNIVEPQSSGIGGGAFMLHYNAAQKSVVAYDGRETAPAAATENYLRWVSDSNPTTPLPNARSSGRSIGTPGVMRMLELAHKDAGVLPWKDLFNPAISIATNGFKVSPRMASSIASVEASLQRDPEARGYFLDANGRAWPAGTLLKSPALATTFNTLATQGAAAFYSGALAQDIVDEIADTTGGITPGLTTLADLSAYQAKKREAVCITYRSKVVCGMPPPSSGGLAVAQALGILETYNLAAFPPSALDDNGGKPAVTGVHLVSEALRLAYADRDKYVADADFVPLPGGSPAAMLDKTYLRQRASLISLSRSMGTAQPGTFPGAAGGVHPPARDNGTTHLSVVDRQGNVVSMTTTIESGFGSFHMTKGGFLLNNQLTDFSAAPADAQGVPIANRLQPGKRPRSSMAPTLVFEAQADGSKGDWVMATGSPGGSTIIQYTTKTLVGVLDWGLNAQQATSMINFGAANSPTTNVGGEHPNVDLANGSANDPLVSGLRSLGHTVSTAALSSGVSTIVRRKDSAGNRVLDGGADPRREGVVLGDVVR
ncbi:gamma-glutamyltransferase [Ideonella paludis]|uniref:gamma-glutamyltransferase n=1 Tax=Ideonella paludis TaxID=1233411 RepID=UPI002873EC8D|nr:gamma-glutamyltransferase [Ideonella paludis]